MTRITRLTASGTRQYLADGYERLEPRTLEVAGQAVAWTNGSWSCARTSWPVRERALHARLAIAQVEAAVFNARGWDKRCFTGLPALQA